MGYRIQEMAGRRVGDRYQVSHRRYGFISCSCTFTSKCTFTSTSTFTIMPCEPSVYILIPIFYFLLPPSAFHLQPSTFNLPPSTFYLQPSTCRILYQKIGQHGFEPFRCFYGNGMAGLVAVLVLSTAYPGECRRIFLSLIHI